MQRLLTNFIMTITNNQVTICGTYATLPYLRKIYLLWLSPRRRREQAGKPVKPYGRDQLYDDYFKFGDYIDHPRGRAVWDITNNRAIIYIDPCINREDVLSQIIDAFDIGDYVVEYDDHYHCKNCVGDLFN